MRILLALATFTCTVVAAPIPYVEKQSKEAVLQTDSPQRAEALKRWLKAPDLARDLLPREGTLPAGFSRALEVEVREGGRLVAVKLRAGRPVADRALFEKMVQRITRQPTEAERQAAAGMQPPRDFDGRMVRGFRGKRILLEESGIGYYDENTMYDQNIRLNPPRLVTPAR